MSDGTSSDVVVVGAGPTGLVLALLVAEAGHEVVVLEKHPAPYPLPRAVGIGHEAMRVLQAAGVMDDVLPILQVTTDGSRVRELLTADGEVLERRHDQGVSISGWPERASFSQPRLEQVLNDRAGAHPRIRVLRGRSVASVEDRGDVAVASALGPDGEEVHLGQVVVGCDGANSVVRGPWAQVEDIGTSFDWLVVDVVPEEGRVVTPHLGQYLGPPRPVTQVSGGPGRRRWEFMRLPHESLVELERADTAWRLLAPFGMTPQNATLERQALYTFRGRWANRWRRGRLVLAGDAAHLMPPFLGEGFNSGIRDAAGLAWRVHAILTGGAGLEVLDVYGSERLGHVRQIITDAVRLGELICDIDPESAARRDDVLRVRRDAGDVRAASEWVLGPGAWRPGDPGAGRLTPQSTVRAGSRTALLDDVVPRGAALVLVRAADAASVMEADRFAQSGVGVVVPLVAPEETAPGPEGSLVDTAGVLLAWLEELGAACALVRPDRYLFGIARCAAEIAGLGADYVSAAGARVRDRSVGTHLQ